ncbi:hypothetical protein HPP92_025817 [Vanilla planifolia]|uniref:Uncharacterized protein n=1 Tax=Vanilla planifolia TaxID=51239 RepID=A0A835PID2_VANPL|nr:hypothetical protein HPP92_025817 [Vanilla planifolia]
MAPCPIHRFFKKLRWLFPFKVTRGDNNGPLILDGKRWEAKVGQQEVRCSSLGLGSLQAVVPIVTNVLALIIVNLGLRKVDGNNGKQVWEGELVDGSM